MKLRGREACFLSHFLQTHVSREIREQRAVHLRSVITALRLQLCSYFPSLSPFPLSLNQIYTPDSQGSSLRLQPTNLLWKGLFFSLRKQEWCLACFAGACMCVWNQLILGQSSMHILHNATVWHAIQILKNGPQFFIFAVTRSSRLTLGYSQQFVPMILKSCATATWWTEFHWKIEAQAEEIRWYRMSEERRTGGEERRVSAVVFFKPANVAFLRQWHIHALFLFSSPRCPHYG